MWPLLYTASLGASKTVAVSLADHALGINPMKFGGFSQQDRCEGV